MLSSIISWCCCFEKFSLIWSPEFIKIRTYIELSCELNPIDIVSIKLKYFFDTFSHKNLKSINSMKKESLPSFLRIFWSIRMYLICTDSNCLLCSTFFTRRILAEYSMCHSNPPDPTMAQSNENSLTDSICYIEPEISNSWNILFRKFFWKIIPNINSTNNEFIHTW